MDTPKATYVETDVKQAKPLNFSDALNLIKVGVKMKRTGWNNTTQFVFLVPGSTFKVSRPPLLGIYEEGTDIVYRPHIDIRNADGSISVWQPLMGDVLAEDWVIA